MPPPGATEPHALVREIAAEVADEERLSEGTCHLSTIEALRGPLADRIETAVARARAAGEGEHADALAEGYWLLVDAATARQRAAERDARLAAEAQAYRARFA